MVINGVGAEAPAGGKSKKEKPSNKGRAESRKAQILDISTHVIANSGYSAATISEIAKRAHLGDATLYGYFENKEAILLAISESFMQDLVSDDDVIFRDAPRAEKDLRNLIWRWIWQLWIEEDFARILILELFRNINFYNSQGYKYLTAFLGKIQKAVEQGQEEGVFIQNVPFPTYLHMITGTLDQYLLPQFLLNRPSPGIAELNHIVDSLVRAIRTKEE